MACPICKHEQFKEVTKSNRILGPGGRVLVDYYLCKNCGVIFKKLKFWEVDNETR